MGMSVLSEPDHDEAPLTRALRERGGDVAVLPWDDPAHLPDAFDICLLRATWNYHLRPDVFRDWIATAAGRTVLRNGAEVVHWNMHKRYLLALADAGVEVIPTVCLDRGSDADLSTVVAARRWRDVVVKPAVSAGSWQTRRFESHETAAGAAFLSGLLADRDMLVQPFMPEFAAGGEVSMVWIDGVITHAVRKLPRFHGGAESVTTVPDLAPSYRRFAESVLEAAGQDALYARIDVVERAGGGLCLSELEFIEPSLFFNHSPPALTRFADAVMRLG
ncbi:MAG: hypothetical protein KDA25_11430 [Phycisphaerales bacterium]|nr:hypothetical protein [Phycisphaerales bacterium]